MTTETLLPPVPLGPWSKSSLSTLLEGCSWQWALDKVWDQPRMTTPANAVGTAYHAALEEHERRRIVCLKDGGDWYADDYWSDYDWLVSRGHEELMKEWATISEETLEEHEVPLSEASGQMEAAIEAWWEHLRPTLLTYRPLMVEPYVQAQHPASTRGLHGYVDWVGFDHETGEWVVIDHKSSKDFRRWPDGGEGHETESELYLQAAVAATQLPIKSGPVRMEWHVARTRTGTRSNFERARIVTAEIDREEAAELLADTLSRADVTVDNYAFAPNPDWFLCSARWCAHWSKCQGPESDGPDALTPERLLPTL